MCVEWKMIFGPLALLQELFVNSFATQSGNLVVIVEKITVAGRLALIVVGFSMRNIESFQDLSLYIEAQYCHYRHTFSLTNQS